MIKCQDIFPDVDGFPCFFGNFFAVLIHYFEVGDIGIEVVVGFTVNVNYAGNLTAMFFHFIS